MAKSLETWAEKNGPDSMNIYAKNAGATLAGLLQRANEVANNKFGLDDEVDLARSLLLRATTYWNAALESPDKVSEETRMLCERVVRDGLDAVARVVAVASKSRVLDEGMISSNALSWVMAEISRVIAEEVREKDPDMADTLVSRIEAIKMPSDKNLKIFMSGSAAAESFL